MVNAVTATETAWGGRLRVSGAVEGRDLHLTRTFDGKVQHKFLRADIHADTPDALRIAVHGDLEWLMRNL